ncbi:MAG: hypothetical protein EA357_07400 [Micavibrio sp.]|nr:MAG: hypothetical protein EA357_07400 [Micavibrio sp.]
MLKNFFKDIFNTNAFPRTIAALPERYRSVAEVNERAGKQHFVNWYGLDRYDCRFYARRCKGNKYEIRFSCESMENVMGESYYHKRVLRLMKNVPLSDAIRIIQQFDEEALEINRRQLETLPEKKREKKIERKRGRNNVRRVQKRLTAANPYRH